MSSIMVEKVGAEAKYHGIDLAAVKDPHKNNDYIIKMVS